MKKMIWLCAGMFSVDLVGISTHIYQQTLSTFPLLYTQNDYTMNQISLEFEPVYTRIFDTNHILNNLTPDGKSFLVCDQQGKGDINPSWLFLESLLPATPYHSVITLQPEQSSYGLLFHYYQQYKNFFVDMRTALIERTSCITIEEVGGNNGAFLAPNQSIVYNAHDAFTQSDFIYGKFGKPQSLIAFDNIQVMIGATGKFHGNDATRTTVFCAGAALLEVPTGTGSQSSWLFEPAVGTNHWAFGGCFDGMLVGRHGYTLVTGGNFRHCIANYEMRTFDLATNGSWSRYLLLEPLGGFSTGPLLHGIPAVRLFTQRCLIKGRNEINAYTRLKKDCGPAYIEVGYNFLYQEAEKIRWIAGMPAGYGIYAIGSGGGISTVSHAHISQCPVDLDMHPVEVTTQDLDKASGAAGMWLSNAFSLRFERMHSVYKYGFGTVIDVACSLQALSSWSCWFNLEYLF